MTLRTISLPNCGIHLYESHHEHGERVNAHHHDIPQVLYALEGEGTIVVDGRHCHVVPDSAVFLPPRCEHAVICDHELTLLVLAFDPVRMRFALLDEAMQSHFRTACCTQLGPFSAAEFRQMLRKLLFEQARADALFGGLAMRVYFFELMLVLARAIHAPDIADSNGLRAERVRAYIDGHYFEKLTADSIGELIGVSARYLNDLFKEQFGTTPAQYLMNVRVELAKKLLVETDKDIAAIGFEVGYETLSTFYRNFKNLTDMSPAKFRQTLQTPTHQ